VVVHFCNPSHVAGGGGKCPSLRPVTGKKVSRPYLKNKLNLKKLGVAQMSEHLPSKHKALSLIPNTVNKCFIKSKIISLFFLFLFLRILPTN
jgi:hypothetical protein